MLAAILLLISACSDKSPTRPSDNWLVIGLEGSPTNLLPGFSTDAYSSRISAVIYSSLIKLDEGGSPVGDLASSYELPDDVTYRFKLKKNAVFHDGRSLTCSDVKYTFDQLRSPAAKSPYRSDFSMIATITCLEPDNIEIRLKQPFAPFMIDMMMGIMPVEVSLIKMDEKGSPVGDLAASYATPDDVTYRFKLRDGVLSESGNKLTCEDVKHTYELIRSPSSKSPYKTDFGKIDKMTCHGDLDFEIRIEKPDENFIFKLLMGIVSRDDKPDKFAGPPVGSGPFMIDELRSDKIVIRRFDKYHGKKALLDGVIFRVLPHNVTRVLELESGGVDLLQNSITPVEFIEYLKEKKGITIDQRPGINYNYLGFNFDHPILKNRLVREAIARGIDRDQIIKYLWRGTAKPAKNLLFPSHWAYNPDVVNYPYSPEISKKLLDKAGYPDPDGPGPKARFHLSYKTSTDRLRRRIAEVMKVQLAQVGIDIDVRSYEWGTFYRDVKSGNFELYTLAWVGVKEPDHYWAVFNSANIPPDGNGLNRNRFRNAEIDSLTEKARATSNPELRKSLYAQVQIIAARELPYVSLYYTDDVVAHWDFVKGWRINPGGDFLCLPDVRIER